MTGKYQAHNEYIDSGIGWLKQIPKHWKRITFKYVLEMTVDNRGRTPPTFDQGIPLLEAKQIDGASKYSSMNFEKYIDEEGHAGFIRDDVKENDILFITVGTIGKTCLVPSSPDYVIAQNIVAFRTKRNHCPLFILFWLRSMAARESMLATNKDSILDSIKISDFVQSRLYIPLFAEQQQIANFLDHETAKIDTLIEKQQQLIKLLKEKRQAVISHAVTKGLSPNAPMRDSGVEWLGEVPAHWVVSRVGFYAEKIGSGKTPKGGGEIYQEDGVLFLRSQNIYDDGLRLSPADCVYISDSIHDEMKGTAVRSGDILLNITGGSIGRTCLVPDEFVIANVNQHVCILRFSENIRKFLSFVMKSLLIKEQINFFQTGGNREGLNFEQISNLIIVIPPEDERKEIILQIESTIETYDQIENRAQKAIDLMKERRTALISAAVTGKIDVRNWSTPENSIINKDNAA